MAIKENLSNNSAVFKKGSPEWKARMAEILENIQGLGRDNAVAILIREGYPLDVKPDDPKLNS
jgi:hypothetical protein